MKNLLSTLPLEMTGGSMPKEFLARTVIVTTNGEELPPVPFEEAGKLAAYYSKNRGSEKIEIDYIEKRTYSKKPKGGKPGFVVYYTNYSLMIDSDISQIKQLED